MELRNIKQNAAEYCQDVRLPSVLRVYFTSTTRYIPYYRATHKERRKIRCKASSRIGVMVRGTASFHLLLRGTSQMKLYDMFVAVSRESSSRITSKFAERPHPPFIETLRATMAGLYTTGAIPTLRAVKNNPHH